MAKVTVDETIIEAEKFLTEPNAFRSILILFISVILAYWLSKFLAKGVTRAAQAIAIRSDNSQDELRQIKLRRIETYLSITIAVLRAVIVAVVAYYTWRFFSPGATNTQAAIGAGALFIVFAGSTIGVMLRDLSAGTAMIAEQWFNVGDYVRIEPFVDVGGVVERATLRSTKLRSLNGDIIWLHNQHIQGVKVTPRGTRTIAVDVFVNDKKRGFDLVKKTVETIPTGTLLITKKAVVNEPEQWGEELWRIIVYGYTAPGREWLIEQYFVDSLKSSDRKSRDKNVLVNTPIVRHADPAAEKNFKRAVRLNE